MRKLVSLCLCSFLLLAFTKACTATNQVDATSKISEAENAIDSAYEAVIAAEKEGASVSVLLERLNSAVEFLSQAQMSQQREDFESAFQLANRSINEIEGLTETAEQLRTSAINATNVKFFWTAVSSTIAASAIALGSLAGWIAMKRRYSALIKQ